MRQFISIAFMFFGGVMLSALAATTLIVPDSSVSWWSWKAGASAFLGAVGGIPMLWGALLRPRGDRVHDVGIALVVAAIGCAMEAYILISFFGSNEEVRRVDPKFAMGFIDYALCLTAITILGGLGGFCLWMGKRIERNTD
jgi:hypothetical protein